MTKLPAVVIVSLLALVWNAAPAETQTESFSIPTNTWIQIKTTGTGNRSQYGAQGLPRFRGWQQVSFDLEFQEIVLFGGSSSTYMSDTWTFNLNEKVWHSRRPHPDPSGPCRRDMHNLVYDPVGKLHWLFNGIAYDNLQPGCGRGATWIYSRSENIWTKIDVSDRKHRLAPGVAYNPDRHEFLQFGGGSVNRTDTTVIFDIAKRAWREIRPQATPPRRINIEGGLVYDHANRVFVLFGGKGDKGALNDTWVFDPATEKWQRKNTTVSPPARELHAMVYDEAQQAIVLFGGRGSKGKLNDTWVYETKKNVWTELENTGNPPALFHHSGVYDRSNRAVIIVDGQNTMVFRFEPGAVRPNSEKPKGESDSSADTKAQRPVSVKSESTALDVRKLSGTKHEFKAQLLRTSTDGSSDDLNPNQSDKSFEIPRRSWIARKLPGRGKGPWAPMKHLRLALNPRNSRIYVLGGDYSGPIGMQSGRNEVYSYSIAGNDWRLEHPYCGPEGSVQPSHPDEVGWVFDTKRNVFWLVPGYMGGDQGVCPESKLVRGQIMTFDPETRKWDWPKLKNSEGMIGNKKFAQYDSKTDTIIRFVWTGFLESEIYDIQRDAWSVKRHGGKAHGIGSEYTAMDPANRHIYVISPRESRLYLYDIDKRNVQAIADIPAKARTDHTTPVWDSVNGVLLWPHINDRRGIVTLFVYDPMRKQWEQMPMNQPEGLTVTGADAVFDPMHNALMVMGGTGKPDNQHIFLYRYGAGRR